MKLGINSYTYMWSIGFQGANPAYPDRSARPVHPMKPLGLLATAQRFGLHLVQTGPNMEFEKSSPTQQDEFIQKAHDWGIELELGTRGLDGDHLRNQVALARRMGAKLIRTLPEIGGVYARDAHSIPPVVRPILPILEREGIRLAIENGKLPAEDLRAVLDEMDSPWVGVVLDMVNSLAVPEGWKEVTRLLAPHTMCVHYKDFTLRRAWHMMGFICEGAPAGKGLVDPVWLFDQLKASPYDFNVIIEIWTPEQATLEETIALEQAWAAESVSFLNDSLSVRLSKNPKSPT
jgi:3-oxoisoapionate decarboxylase